MLALTEFSCCFDKMLVYILLDLNHVLKENPAVLRIQNRGMQIRRSNP